jgi:hypothetical protein
MSDPNSEISARRVDTDVAVSPAGSAGLALFGVLKDPVAHEKGCLRS